MTLELFLEHLSILSNSVSRDDGLQSGVLIMPNTLVCTVARSEIEAIMRDLHASGFLSSDISILVGVQSGSLDRAHEHHEKTVASTVAGSRTGTFDGNKDGGPVGIRILAVPGMGPLIVAGPIIATLNGAALTETIDGLRAVFIDIGISEREARRYERKVRSGSALICVRANEPDDAVCARGIFELAGAENIFAVGEVTDEDRQVRADSDRNFIRLEARVPWLL